MQMILKSHLFFGFYAPAECDGRTGPHSVEKSCALRNNAGPRINLACGAPRKRTARSGRTKLKKTAVSERENGACIDQGGKRAALSPAFSRWGCGFSMNMQNTITKRRSGLMHKLLLPDAEAARFLPCPDCGFTRSVCV